MDALGAAIFEAKVDGVALLTIEDCALGAMHRVERTRAVRNILKVLWCCGESEWGAAIMTCLHDGIQYEACHLGHGRSMHVTITTAIYIY